MSARLPDSGSSSGLSGAGGGGAGTAAGFFAAAGAGAGAVGAAAGSSSCEVIFTAPAEVFTPNALAMAGLMRGAAGSTATFSTFRAGASRSRSSGNSVPGRQDCPSSEASHFSVSCPRSRSSFSSE